MYLLEQRKHAHLMVCRAMANLLLPLDHEVYTESVSRLADLATNATPHPALRFADVFISSPVTPSATWKEHARSLVASMPRYDDGGIVKSSAGLLISRGLVDDSHQHRPHLHRCACPIDSYERTSAHQ
jgi:hypothetical protein